MKYHILTAKQPNSQTAKQPKLKLLKVVCFLLLNVLLFTCQKDDFERVEQNNSKDYPDIHSQIISLDEVKQNSKLQKSLSKISKNFDINKTKTKNKASSLDSPLNSNSRIDANDGSFSILTEEILYVTSNGGEAWSFKIETPLLAEATFENFVITDNGEDIKFFIYSYITLDFNEEHRHFLISVLPIEDDLIDVIDFQGFMNTKMHLIDGCLYNIPEDGGVIQTIWCSDGAGEGSVPTSTGGGLTNGGNGWVYHVIDGKCIRQKVFNGNIITEYNVPCPPGYGETPEDGSNGTSDPSDENDGNWDEWDLEDGHFPDNSDVGGSSGGGNSTPSTVEPAVGSLPSVGEPEITPKEKVLECLNDNNITLSPTQLEWLNNSNNGIKIKGMSTMIGNVGCEDMINIILEYIDESPPSQQDFRDYADEKLECYGIQELMNNNDFTDALDDLQDYIDDNEDDEMGYEVSLNGSEFSTNFVEGHFGGVKLNHGGSIIGGMHTHPEQGIPMFSGQDIYKLFAYAMQNNNSTYLETFSVLVTNNGTYMIKIRDLNNLNTVFQLLGETGRKAAYKLNQKLEHNYYNQTSINENNFLSGLIDTFNSFGLSKSPIRLFKLNQTGTTFNKVVLTNNQPVEIPCN